MTYEILAYLVDHPEAQDTVEGIVEWWLLEQQIKRQAANIKKTLTELVARGFILELKGEDSRTYYRINRQKLQEIRALLTQRSGVI